MTGVSPDTVERAVLARLGRLGDDATSLARAVAVLETATLQQAAALARLDDQTAAEAADSLVAAQILAAEPLLFVHPLLRRSVYEQIPPAQRATDHRRAALLLAEAGPGNAAIGAHLLRASPAGEPEVVRLRSAWPVAGGACPWRFARGDRGAAGPGARGAADAGS